MVDRARPGEMTPAPAVAHTARNRTDDAVRACECLAGLARAVASPHLQDDVIRQPRELVALSCATVRATLLHAVDDVVAHAAEKEMVSIDARGIVTSVAYEEAPAHRVAVGEFPRDAMRVHGAASDADLSVAAPGPATSPLDAPRLPARTVPVESLANRTHRHTLTRRVALG